ncbi:hypothetical protein PAL_GLEAN10003699 [Pteropus alecto]|uniref:Uncharacterized protein n=1 Tax=Pteropus alecto TaxID=9402 RepID=L5K5P4_PTEAL|nr:hypothetical protein PAL_GLEAN10003699 [Pteropus alecto]
MFSSWLQPTVLSLLSLVWAAPDLSGPSPPRQCPSASPHPKNAGFCSTLDLFLVGCDMSSLCREGPHPSPGPTAHQVSPHLEVSRPSQKNASKAGSTSPSHPTKRSVPKAVDGNSIVPVTWARFCTYFGFFYVTPPQIH